MRSDIVAIVGCALLVSGALNIYLYIEKTEWEQAWLNQFIATSEIESILKQAANDTTIGNIKSIAVRQFGENNVRVVELKGKLPEYGSGYIALGVNDTLLLFKDGIYHGSKANLPNH
jgi:hypothetical protein